MNLGVEVERWSEVIQERGELTAADFGASFWNAGKKQDEAFQQIVRSSQKGRDEKVAFAWWGWKQLMKVSHKQNLAKAKEQLELTLEAWGEEIMVMSILTEKEKS